MQILITSSLKIHDTEMMWHFSCRTAQLTRPTLARFLAHQLDRATIYNYSLWGH